MKRYSPMTPPGPPAFSPKLARVLSTSTTFAVVAVAVWHRTSSTAMLAPGASRLLDPVRRWRCRQELRQMSAMLRQCRIALAALDDYDGAAEHVDQLRRFYRNVERHAVAVTDRGLDRLAELTR